MYKEKSLSIKAQLRVFSHHLKLIPKNKKNESRIRQREDRDYNCTKWVVFSFVKIFSRT